MNKTLNILFISRATLYTVKGGDTIQMLKTAEELRNLGLHVEIKLCNDKSIDYKKYDLVHYFNIIRPADILIHIQKSQLPFVISTIFVEYTSYEDQASRENWKKKILNLFSPDTREYIKVIGRMIVNKESITSLNYLWLGQRRSIRYILKRASILLPNSKSECNRLFNTYKIDKEYIVVNNAADAQVFNYTPESIKHKDAKMIICVGRIEGRKNQLNLIKAINNTEYELYIIGNPAPNHISYYLNCKEIASSNIHFIEQVNQSELLSYYKIAKVHVLPSWFETTGLSSLEALFCGCNIVVTKYGDTTEYFDEKYCEFCDPSSVKSIKESIIKASKKDVSTNYIEECINRYNWKKAAETTRSAYIKVLGKA